jgi:plasmid stabilization system protein ParE
VRVEWSDVAAGQLDEIAGGRALWSEASAIRLRASVLRRTDQIADFPRSGRMIPEFQMEHLREVLEQGYRILYEVFEDRVEVFGVADARRDVFAEDE